MLINFATTLNALDGEPLEMQKSKQGPNVLMTLGAAVVEALLVHTDMDNQLSGTVKFARWKLAQKITEQTDEGNVDVTIDEIKMMKDRVGEVCTAIVVGPAFLILEG